MVIAYAVSNSGEYDRSSTTNSGQGISSTLPATLLEQVRAGATHTPLTHSEYKQLLPVVQVDPTSPPEPGGKGSEVLKHFVLESPTSPKKQN